MNTLNQTFCLAFSEIVSSAKTLKEFCAIFNNFMKTRFPHSEYFILLGENAASWKVLNLTEDINSKTSQLITPTTPILSINTKADQDNHFESSWLCFNLANDAIPYCRFFISDPNQFEIDNNSRKLFSRQLSDTLNRIVLSSPTNTCDHPSVQNDVNKEEQGLLNQLHILHKISIRLWHAKSLDNMLHTAVYECTRELEIDRMAIFLSNSRTGLMRGTYGTDINGNVTNEHWYCTAIDSHFHAKNTLDKGKHITIYNGVPLYHNNNVVGIGWNSTISLWDSDEIIGWIACDNLISGTPLKDYHNELLKLLGVTISQHLIQRRAQDALKALNTSLEQRIVQRTSELQKANKQLKQLSQKDSLTGISNRRMFDEKIEEEWRRAVRHNLPISLLMIDIDYFKQYNDHYGHCEGDTCLIHVANTLNNVERRAGSLFARFGGEEFVYLLPNYDEEKTKVIAERALESIRAMKKPHNGSHASENITISVGVCTMHPDKHDYNQTLIYRADKALYQAKTSGKDKVCYYHVS